MSLSNGSGREEPWADTIEETGLGEVLCWARQREADIIHVKPEKA